MPFMGRDWRSPGECWVKTESFGWQRMKLIEAHLFPANVAICRQTAAAASSGCDGARVACSSWPPKQYVFGQHMAANCCRDESLSPPASSPTSSSGRGGSGSGDSSESGSSAASPTSSPERGHHHLHPIVISSPYGQFNGSLTSPCCCAAASAGLAAQPASVSQSMSRSLSRESLPLPVCERQQTMRHNRSISDFHHLNGSPASSGSQQPVGAASSAQPQQGASGPSHQPSMAAEPSAATSAGSHNQDQSVGRQAEDEDREASTGTTRAHYCCPCNSLHCCQQQQQLQQQHPSPQSHHRQQTFFPLKEASNHQAKTAPFCPISVRTREVAMYNTISEAFYRLDFCNAIHDIRRFNYICKLLHLLITQNLTSLSGCATKVLFTMLEQVAWEVSSNKRNIHVLKNLLNELKDMIRKYYCWGRPIGSSLLWQQHFDTIERISQIVNAIELSPPKKDNDQVTFDKLPVEMIREILLRLNDYRDLVNSARASPVMQTMINNQYIWQRLCRYHFTDQQLKLALENRDGSFTGGKRNALRRVKYARTVTADGRGSYRNRIEHKPNNGGTCAAPAAKSRQQQIEQQTNNNEQRALARANRRDPSPDSSSSSSPTSSSSSGSSYVTKAIRIFDKEGSSLTLGNSRAPRPLKRERQSCGQATSTTAGIDGQQTASVCTKSANEQQPPKGSGNGGEADRTVNGGESVVRNANHLRNHEIDWERVFHQLRKKFDLKEEYADCLQLCRHCRCLFWKSFGHPCIRNDEDCFGLNEGQVAASGSPNDGQGTGVDRSGSSTANVSRSQSTNNNYHHYPHHQLHQSPRPSVASLSRNFDNGSTRSTGREADETENIAPSCLGSNEAGQQRRLESESLGARLQERRARVLNRRLNVRNLDDNESNNNNNILRGDKELVPKHVTITPQAFLKFFSL